MVGVRIAAFIDDVKIFAQRGVVRHDVDWLSAAGFKEALFRVKPGKKFAVFINFQQRGLRTVIGIVVLGIFFADTACKSRSGLCRLCQFPVLYPG